MKQNTNQTNKGDRMVDFELFQNVAASDARLAIEILERISVGDSQLTRRCDLNRVKHWLARVSSNVDTLLSMSEAGDQ
jgi:hypothetical protein